MGRAQIYEEMEDDYLSALDWAEEHGVVTYTVYDPKTDDSEDFEDFDEAVRYAESIGVEEIEASDFTICWGAYCDGQYTEYSAATLNLYKEVIDWL